MIHFTPVLRLGQSLSGCEATLRDAAGRLVWLGWSAPAPPDALEARAVHALRRRADDPEALAWLDAQPAEDQARLRDIASQPR